MSKNFPKPNSLGRKVKVKLNLSDYATKADLKIATGVDASKFVKKVNLSSFKSKIDKLDIGKLKATPVT